MSRHTIKDKLILINSSKELQFYQLSDIHKLFEKQSSRRVLKKRCSENMQQICGRHPRQSAISIKLLWNFTSAWMFSCKCAAYFENKSILEDCFCYLIWKLRYSWLCSLVKSEMSNNENKQLIGCICQLQLQEILSNEFRGLLSNKCWSNFQFTSWGHFIYKKAFLKNFTRFVGKHLYWSNC